MKQILLLCTAFCIIYGVSCKKEDEERVTMRTEFITANPWRVTEMTMKQKVGLTPTVETDMYDLMPDCQRDNEFTFHMDQTISVDEGEEKCDPDAPQSYTIPSGRWSFLTADTQLELADTNGSVVWDILKLNDTILLVRNTQITDDTITTTITTRYNPVR